MNQRRNSEPTAFPGPWKLSGDESAIVDGNGGRILTINMGYGEADLDYWPKALAVMLAAPDMLAALETARVALDVAKVTANMSVCKKIDEALPLVAAALARAKGTP
jgi:hypothetical protein